MADRIDDIERRLTELEQEIRDLRSPQRSALGTKTRPVSLVYLLDDRTGAVAEVRYDRDNSDIRTQEVR